jgi:hypothetical protein
MSAAFITYLHYQPKPGPFSYFDIGKKDYFSPEDKELGLISMVSNVIEPLLKKLEADYQLKVNLSISIPVLEGLKAHPGIADRLVKLISAGQLEIMAGLGYNALSLLFSHSLFQLELERHLSLIKEVLGVKPGGYMNTALVYSDALGLILEEKGFKYAVAPNVSWFIKKKQKSLFKAKNSKLNLIVPQLEKGTADDPAEIYFREHIDNLPRGLELNLLSAIKSSKTPVQLSLPELVAQDAQGRGIDSIVGNSLQKDFLKRLSELSHAVVACGDDSLISDFFWLGSYDHFAMLTGRSADRHKVYTKLFTMLYDIEIRTRA